MDDKEGRSAAPVDYKRHQISLIPDQQADGTWVCRYVIIESEKQREFKQGYPDGRFPSREAAELAALQKAKALIDSR